MNIVIPFEGRVTTVIRSSFLAAKRVSETKYNLTGEAFQMSEITASQVIIFSDEVEIAEGETLTEELLARALPLDQFITVTTEEALSNALGLLLRLAVADGRVTDEELLSIQPVLEGRTWRAGLAAQIGDVYAYDGHLWKCIQAHTTQSTWTPDITPVLWRKVEIVPESNVRVWVDGVDYAVGDEVAYPDESGTPYTCLQAHISLTDWEPPNVPALWQAKNEREMFLEPTEVGGEA